MRTTAILICLAAIGAVCVSIVLFYPIEGVLKFLSLIFLFYGLLFAFVCGLSGLRLEERESRLLEERDYFRSQIEELRVAISEARQTSIDLTYLRDDLSDRLPPVTPLEVQARIKSPLHSVSQYRTCRGCGVEGDQEHQLDCPVTQTVHLYRAFESLMEVYPDLGVSPRRRGRTRLGS